MPNSTHCSLAAKIMLLRSLRQIFGLQYGGLGRFIIYLECKQIA